MVGPWNRKTFIKVAGEAEGLLLISGSEFVEMFVGVGASRVRDLSKELKATLFVFIDEIDATGQGAGIGGEMMKRTNSKSTQLKWMDEGIWNNNCCYKRPDILDSTMDIVDLIGR